jgi:predicted SAM-dependent methyltransferase
MIRELARNTARLVIPEPMRFPARIAITRALAPRERRKTLRLLRSRPLLLHLGCGFLRKQGWVNIDLVGTSAEVFWDLLEPLPFPDDCADGVYHEHVLEHFSVADGLRVLTNCFHVLQPRGILRVVVPDVRRYAESYVNDPAMSFIHNVRPGHATGLLAFQEIFFKYGHRAAYDAETLRYVLHGVGFVDIRECQCNETELPHPPDNEDRRLESLYVECRKPGNATGEKRV